MSCTDCPKRLTCTELCDDANRYANKDVKFHNQVIQFDAVNPPQHHIRERIGLTNREYQIALLLNAGLNNHDISEALDISPITVRRHRQQLRKKHMKLNAFCTV